MQGLTSGATVRPSIDDSMGKYTSNDGKYPGGGTLLSAPPSDIAHPALSQPSGAAAPAAFACLQQRGLFLRERMK